MIELVLHKGNGKEENYSRDDANLIEMEAYFELADKIRKGVTSKKEEERLTRPEQLHLQAEFIAMLFKNQGVTKDDVLKGVKAKEFDKVTEDLYRQISPSDFERADELRKKQRELAERNQSSSK